MKKFLAILLAAMMLLSLVACNPSGEGGATPTPGGSDPTDPPATAKSFQFYGKYEEEGEFASMMASAFLLNLNEDGTAVVDKYAFGNYDASDAASNPSFSASYMSGTWKEVEKDGVPCLQIKLACVDAAGNESDNQTAYAYDVAGVYSFDMTFPVVPGMSYSRVASMEGKAEKTYADANAFIQAYKKEFVAPESVGTFTDAEHNGTAYLQENGTMLLYAGYDKFAEGTWSLGMTGLSLTLNGEAVEVTMDGMKASFSTSRDLAGNVMNYTFVCEDITKIAGTGAPADGGETGGDEPTEEEGIASYKAGGLVLVCMDETNMKVKFPEYKMEREGFTYVLDGNTLTVTAPGEDVLGAFGQIWSAMGAEKWTIDGDTATKAE